MHVNELTALLVAALPYLEDLKSIEEDRGYNEAVSLHMLINRIKQAINEQEALKIGHLARS